MVGCICDFEKNKKCKALSQSLCDFLTMWQSHYEFNIMEITDLTQKSYGDGEEQRFKEDTLLLQVENNRVLLQQFSHLLVTTILHMDSMSHINSHIGRFMKKIIRILHSSTCRLPQRFSKFLFMLIYKPLKGAYLNKHGI